MTVLPVAILPQGRCPFYESLCNYCSKDGEESNVMAASLLCFDGLAPIQAWRIATIAQLLWNKDAKLGEELNLMIHSIPIVANGHECTETYVKVCFSAFDLWDGPGNYVRADSHITLLKHRGAASRCVLPEDVEVLVTSRLKEIIVGGLSFSDRIELFNQNEDPRRYLLPLDKASATGFWEIRNLLKQSLGIVEKCSEERSGFHLSIDQIHDALPREPFGPPESYRL